MEYQLATYTPLNKTARLKTPDIQNKWAQLPKQTSDPTYKYLRPTDEGSKVIKYNPSGFLVALYGKLLHSRSPKEVILNLHEPILTKGGLLTICPHEISLEYSKSEEPPEDATSIGRSPGPKAAPHVPEQRYSIPYRS